MTEQQELAQLASLVQSEYDWRVADDGHSGNPASSLKLMAWRAAVNQLKVNPSRQEMDTLLRQINSRGRE